MGHISTVFDIGAYEVGQEVWVGVCICDVHDLDYDGDLLEGYTQTQTQTHTPRGGERERKRERI